jgi:hypothetical protein
LLILFTFSDWLLVLFTFLLRKTIGIYQNQFLDIRYFEVNPLIYRLTWVISIAEYSVNRLYLNLVRLYIVYSALNCNKKSHRIVPAWFQIDIVLRHLNRQMTVEQMKVLCYLLFRLWPEKYTTLSDWALFDVRLPGIHTPYPHCSFGRVSSR